MKKYLFILTVWMVLIQVTSANEIIVNDLDAYHLGLSLQLSNFEILNRQLADGREYQFLSNSNQSYPPGKPDLPASSIWLLVPNSTTPKLDISPGESLIISDLELGPVQYPQTDSNKTPENFVFEESIYSQDVFFPTQLAYFEPIKQKRGQDCTLLWIQPYQYNPIQKKLRYYPDLKINVSFSGISQPLPENIKNINPSDFSYAVNHLEVLREESTIDPYHSRSFRENGADLIIITIPEFIEAAQDLASWKLRKGITSKIVDSDYLGNDPVAIDNYITDAFYNWDIAPSYLILFGDAELVPTWYENEHISGGDQGHTAADMYYADINDPPDLLVDLGFGRIPVETVEQAENYVAHVIEYESEPPQDNYYYNWVTAACYYQDSDGNSIADRRFAKTSEDIRNFLLNDYEVERVYYTDPNVNPLYWNDNDYVFENDEPMAEIPEELQRPNFAWDGNAYDIINSVNRGTGFLYHRDHGFRQGWGDPYFDINHVNSLTNGPLRPVVWTINCCTGWFDNETDDDVCDTDYNSESFVEYWVRHLTGGSVGLIGATRVSFSGYNDRLAWGLTDAIWPGFLEWCNVSYPEHYPIYSMGDVLSYGKEYMMANYQDSDYRTTALDEFNWFGDPTLEIWSSEPQMLTVNHDNQVILGSTEFTINCEVNGALVVLIDNNEILAQAEVFNGTANLQFPQINSLSALDLCVTAHDYEPYTSELEVIAVGPFVVCDSVFFEESGNYIDGSLQSLDVIFFDLTIENIGIEATSEDLTLNLSTQSEFVVINNSQAFEDALEPGEIVTLDNAFEIELLAGINDGDQIPFTVEISSGTTTWNSELLINCQGPDLHFIQSTFQPTSGEDTILDPGETAEIFITYSNTGNGFSYDLNTMLLCYDPYASLSGSDVIPILPPGEIESTVTPILIEVSQECPVDYYITLEIFAYDLVGSIVSEQFTIPIGFIEENFETGEDIWEHEALEPDYLDEWHLSSYRNYTPDGSYSMKCGGEGLQPYSNNILAALYMPVLDVSGGIMVSFHHWMNTNILPGNIAHDGGIIEISTDGINFLQIEPIGGYPATSMNIPNLPFPPETPLFAGNIVWEEVQLDLTSYSGEVQIRFVFGSSSGLITGEGWYLDNFHIINYQTTTDNNLLPVKTNLAQNYPNPFNPENDGRSPGTIISYQLAEEANVKLTIFNLKGQVINVLVDNQTISPGRYTLSWNGKDKQGKAVSSGIYFYRLETEKQCLAKKMILLK